MPGIFNPIAYANVATDQEWSELARLVDPSQKNTTLRSLLCHVRELGCGSVVLESCYLDQDFSAEFSAFYSKVFKPHTKLCTRIHFFAQNLLKGDFDVSALRAALIELSANSADYLGFVVVRPIQMCVGRTVLRPPHAGAGFESHVLIRARYQTHLLGVTLEVEGTPFVQQDRRVGACAQAAIWMCGRHFHTKHREPWISIVNITEEASKHSDIVLNQSLPAGSGGLGLSNITRALRYMGREPFVYLARCVQTKRGTAAIWPQDLRPEEIINRYVDSGIPVILALLPWSPHQQEWHANVVIGHTLNVISENVSLLNNPTKSIFCGHFLVNDDQIGFNIRMPLCSGRSDSQTPYSVFNNVAAIIVPLPSKVYIKAESAEALAWDALEQYGHRIWPILKESFAKDIAKSIHMAEGFLDCIHNNKVIARTYLTYGWKYKSRLCNNIVSSSIKSNILPERLPRYVWVTEFGTLSSFNKIDARERRVYAHVVVDATSNEYSDTPLIVHMPAYLQINSASHDNVWEPINEKTMFVPDDIPYFTRIRGDERYSFST